MLNLLSRYAGYANWDDFVFRNREAEQGKEAVIPSAKHANKFFLLVPALAIVIVLLFYGIFSLFNTREYSFCFFDADTHEQITGTRIELTLLQEGESPVQFLARNGCILLKTDKSRLKMVVKAPYYQEDTVIRVVRKLNRDEKVMLRADDYALMLHYFSMMKVDDWNRRREKLESMFDDGAMICQVVNDKDATGMALFNKREFIDKMTMPARSLKNIEILSSQMQNGKIKVLRFRINEKKK
jgi:hypothetical protein